MGSTDSFRLSTEVLTRHGGITIAGAWPSRSQPSRRAASVRLRARHGDRRSHRRPDAGALRCSRSRLDLPGSPAADLPTPGGRSRRRRGPRRAVSSARRRRRARRGSPSERGLHGGDHPDARRGRPGLAGVGGARRSSSVLPTLRSGAGSGPILWAVAVAVAFLLPFAVSTAAGLERASRPMTSGSATGSSTRSGEGVRRRRRHRQAGDAVPGRGERARLRRRRAEDAHDRHGEGSPLRAARRHRALLRPRNDIHGAQRDSRALRGLVARPRPASRLSRGLPGVSRDPGAVYRDERYTSSGSRVREGHPRDDVLAARGRGGARRGRSRWRRTCPSSASRRTSWCPRTRSGCAGTTPWSPRRRRSSTRPGTWGRASTGPRSS